MHIKKKKNVPPPQGVIIISDSDDDSMWCKGKQKTLGPSPISSTVSLSGSDEIQKVANPPVQKRTLPLQKRHPTQEQIAGLKEALSKVEVFVKTRSTLRQLWNSGVN